MWPSRPCYRFESHGLTVFTAPFGLISISGYKLLYLYPFPIFRFPRLIIHVDSLRVVLYLSSASMPMDTRLLLSAGTCRTWCMMIALTFSGYPDFTLLPVAESDGASRFGRVVRKPLEVWGSVECDAGVLQPRMCILCNVVNFFDCGVL